jgi:hypothetical protein
MNKSHMSKLSQSKMPMKNNNSSNVLRKMAGVTSPGSKKRKVQQHMSNQLSLQTKKESSAIGSKMASKNPGAPGAAKLNLLEKPGS